MPLLFPLYTQIKDVPAVSDGVLLGLTGHRRLGELGVLHCEVGLWVSVWVSMWVG